jgi:hypothetical protein
MEPAVVVAATVEVVPEVAAPAEVAVDAAVVAALVDAAEAAALVTKTADSKYAAADMYIRAEALHMNMTA